MCIVIVYLPSFDVINFEIDFWFLIKPFFVHDQKFKTKTQIFENEKSFQDKVKKHFSSFLKGFN